MTVMVFQKKVTDMRFNSMVTGLFAGLAFFCTSCAAADGKGTNLVEKAIRVPQSACRVQVLVLAFDRGAIEPLLKESKLSAPALLSLWEAGKGRLFAVQSTLASSASGGGKMDATRQEYLYKGTRYVGATMAMGATSGTPAYVPDYEQRNLGMTLRAAIVDGAEAKAPVITVDASEDFTFKPKGDALPESGGIEKFSSVGTIKASTTCRMPFGEQILLGGGAESPDKKEFLFVIGRADPADESEKK